MYIYTKYHNKFTKANALKKHKKHYNLILINQVKVAY